MTSNAPQGDLINGRYRVIGPLGSGGAGDVVLAADLAADDRPVAIKRLGPRRPFSDASGPGADSLRAEFEALVRLSHPNIVQVHDLETDRRTGDLFLTMEAIEGPGLIAAAAALGWRERVGLIVQICRGLGYMHARGVLHNDLKPANVLVTGTDPPVCKLSDFGLSTARGGAGEGIRGTVLYIAPEVLLGSPPAKRSDLWALGVIAYEILGGRPPFEGSPDEILNGVTTRAPEGLRRHNAEIPGALETCVMRLLSRGPEARPADASEVIEGLGAAVGTPFDVETTETIVSWARTAPIVGRKEALRRIDAHIGGIVKPDPKSPKRAVAIAGEMGSGKTRLVEEMRRESQVRGAAWGAASCYEGAGSPLQPFLTILARVAPDAIEDSALAPLFRPGDDAARASSGPDPEHAMRRIVDAAAHHLLEAAARRPLVVVIENLQWADAASGRLLEHLARNLGGAPSLLMVTTYRTEDAEVRPLSDLLDRLHAAASWETIATPRLTRDEVASMLAGMFDLPSVPDPLVESMHRGTEGNPLHVQIAVESLLEEHASAAGGAARRPGAEVIGSLDSILSLPLPSTIVEALRRRLACLTAAQMRILEVLAVAEAPIDATLLRKIVGLIEGGPVHDPATALEGLVRRRLVATALAADGGTSIRIDHVRLREHVYETMDWGARSALHGHLGRALSSRPDADLETVAHHFVHSDDVALALDYAERAGTRAAEMFATGQAVTFLRRALDLVPPDDATRRIRIQILLAETLWRAGDPAGATEMAERAIRGARTAGQKETAWKATCRLAMIQSLTGKAEEAERTLDRLIDTLRAENDAVSLAFGLTTRANIEAARGRFAESRRLNEEALALRRSAGDREGMTANLNNLGNLDLVLGPTDEGRRIFEENIALRREMSDLRRAADSLTNLGQWHRRRGALDEAAACSRQAIDMATELRDRWSRAVYGCNLAVIERDRGRPDAALAAARRAVADARAMGHHQAACEALDHLGTLERDLGRWKDAVAAHEEGVAIARRHGIATQEAFCLLSLAWDRLASGQSDDRAPAREAIRRARKHAGSIASPRVTIRLHVAEALLALAEGHGEEALRGARGAREAAHEARMVDEEVSARLIETEVLLSRTGVEDPEEAARVASDAARLARSAGLADAAWRAEAWLAEAAARGHHPTDERRHLSTALAGMEEMAGRITDEECRRTWLAAPRQAHLAQRAADRPEIAMRIDGAADTESRGALAAIYRITEIIASISDLDALLDQVLEVALGIVGGERGLIILIDEKTGEQQVRAARDLEKETVEDAVSYSRSVVKEAAGGRVMVALHAGDDERLRAFRSVSLYSIKSLMCVPMKVHDTILGTVYVDSRRRGTPFSQQDLRFLEAFAALAAGAIRQARLHQRLTIENTYLRKEAGERNRYHNIIGKSTKMQAVYDMVEKVSSSDLPVLIEGESGTGKELVARALHYSGPRRRRPFQSENVAAIAENLLESELFGHVKGAFTGADRDRQGLFEMADGGTLFLDEVGDMPLPMQAKLLRALQEGEIRPVGGKDARKVDVRVISATNKDLTAKVREKTFREDLFYRLHVVRIALPPLRERKEDIPLLVDHFLSKAAPPGTAPKKMEIGALQLLVRYSWPGNVRELENEVRKLAVLSPGDRITQRDVMEDQELYEKITRFEEERGGLASMEETEKRQIEKALAESGGNRAEAARLLGISRATIFRKMRRYGISA